MESKKATGLEITMLWESTVVLVTGFPVLTSVAAGLMVGWSCRHKWLPVLAFLSRRPFGLLSAPLMQLGAKRVSLVLAGMAVVPAVHALWRWIQQRVVYSTFVKGKPTLSAAQGVAGSNRAADNSPKCICATCNQDALHITEDDLKYFVDRVDGKVGADEPPWERIIDQCNDSVSYVMSRRDPLDGGPTEYLSSSIFENADSEALREFYMDGNFRQEWDPLTVSTSQVAICKETGNEWGRIVKKFPLFSREYVLVWRIWIGSDGSSYCVIKECEHPLSPRQVKPQRIEFYRSFWRINQVPGRKAAEVVALHREDVGMQKDMAKMAVRRGSWTFVRKMEPALRIYSARRNARQSAAGVGAPEVARPDALSLGHPVPAGLVGENSSDEDGDKSERTPTVSSRGSYFRNSLQGQVPGQAIYGPGRRRGLRRRLFATLLLAGSTVVLAHGAAPLGAKVIAMSVVQSTHRRFWAGRGMAS